MRILLLVAAIAGFVIFFSFHAERIGPRHTITVGISSSPWLTYSQVHGLGEFGKKATVNLFSWSAGGLLGALIALTLRARIKG